MNHLKLLYYKIIEWINIQTQLIITKAEYRYNNKNIVSKQHIVKYDNIKKKLNTTINLHAISIKNFVDALSSIDIELKSVNKNIVFTLNNYSNYAKKEYKIAKRIVKEYEQQLNIFAVSGAKRKVCPVCKKTFEKGWGEFCSQDCWDTDM